MTTRVEAAQALESFGWGLVKYAQKVKAGNVGMAKKWYIVAKARQEEFSKKRINAWAEGLLRRKKFPIPNKSRRFTAGQPPYCVRAVDVFRNREGVIRKCFRHAGWLGFWRGKDFVLLDPGFDIKAWRYSV